MLVENEATFISALKADLNKPVQETIMAEIDFLRYLASESMQLSQERCHWPSAGNWRLDERHVSNLQPFPISAQPVRILNFPQICSKVTFDSPGHRSHSPWTVWDSSCHRWLSPEVLIIRWCSSSWCHQVPGTTHFSCLLPRCCQPLQLATVSSSNQGDLRRRQIHHMIEFLSEIAPATASAISQLLPKYLDQVAFLPENHPNPRYSGMHQSSGRWSARNNGTPEGDLSLNCTD